MRFGLHDRSEAQQRSNDKDCVQQSASNETRRFSQLGIGPGLPKLRPLLRAAAVLPTLADAVERVLWVRKSTNTGLNQGGATSTHPILPSSPKAATFSKLAKGFKTLSFEWRRQRSTAAAQRHCSGDGGLTSVPGASSGPIQRLAAHSEIPPPFRTCTRTWHAPRSSTTHSAASSHHAQPAAERHVAHVRCEPQDGERPGAAAATMLAKAINRRFIAFHSFLLHSPARVRLPA